MAVEARHHMALFPSQLTKSNQVPINMYNSSQLGMGLPLLTEPIMPETLLPFYPSTSVWENPTSAIGNNVSLVNNKADSGLTYNLPPVVSNVRKRPRDPLTNHLVEEDFSASLPQKTKLSPGITPFSLFDDEIGLQILQQQSEIDRFIAQHNEKVQIELGERRKRQSRMLVSAIQETISKKIKEKEEELQMMGKMNWALQERLKSLYVENQLWRDLAQTNEATANTLRSNLEQVLAHVTEDRHVSTPPNLADDAESSCGSIGHDEGLEEDTNNNNCNNNNTKKRACKKCGERESSVLLLPCRHLCLCTLCGSSSVGSCPVCDSTMSASVHVNLLMS